VVCHGNASPRPIRSNTICRIFSRIRGS
jgi:hypothetical protein